MATHDDDIVIGIPQVYEMILKLNTKIDKSDEDNRLRDEANQKEIRGWIKGNGKEGLETRESKSEQNIKIIWWFIRGIAVAILGCAFFIIRVGMVQ